MTDYLQPRKSVRFSPIKSPATAVPIPSQLAPAFSGIPPVEQLAAVRGKTPPVARSPSPASRKSPRSTPSETPARAFSKSMSPLTDDDEADDNDGDDSLIPKPSGQCGRLKRDGYSLEETLQWGEDYEKIYVRSFHDCIFCEGLNVIARNS